jgi:hypothetical protein
MALSCLIEAKRRSTDLTVQTMITQSIAEVLFNMGLFMQALGEQRVCQKLLAEIFGPEDERVGRSFYCVIVDKLLTVGCVQALEAKTLVEKYLRASTEKNVKDYRQMQLAASQEEALAAGALAMGKQIANPSEGKRITTDASKKKGSQGQTGKKKAVKK